MTGPRAENLERDQQYVEQRLTVGEIATRAGVGYLRVWEVLKHLGLLLPPGHRSSRAALRPADRRD
ncbi:hypothetical protein ATK36_5263 [Amycolatopsis sulphurea]|uniref:Uncharacterized protein n=1 Tax=Amycolatopsis sulphurea TaxID=76022 RepID=A0A2A9FH40_9PSEU|nr:hypothetical protein [Amycolatopsis sulphurea]PFG50061.1 hypothetical protein ATK36_5263 [Amycolatopsis sulphurea]